MKFGDVLEGNLAGFVGACLLGSSAAVTRGVVGHIGPLNLAFLRFALGGLFLAAIVVLVQKRSLRFPRTALPRIAVFGVMMYALLPTLFNTAMRYTTASRGAVILATIPLFTAIIGALTHSERLVPLQWLGVAVSIFGIVVIFAEAGLGFGAGRTIMLGNAIMVGAALTGATSNVLVKPIVRSFESLPVTVLAMIIGAGALLPLAALGGALDDVRRASTETNLLVLYLGIPGGAVAFFLATFAISRLSVTQASLYINLNPVVASILGAIFLHETLTRWFGLGFLLVVLGLFMANLPKRGSQPAAVGNQPRQMPKSPRA